VQIDVLRPLSARKVGSATTQPSGGGNTVASVTADNNDATYVIFPTSGGGNWSARMEPHTPAAGFQRHQVRGRMRAYVDAGTVQEDLDVGRGTSDYISFGQFDLTDTVAEYVTGWSQQDAFNLGQSGSITDFNMGGGYPDLPDGGATQIRTTEIYLDVDTRERPQYTAQVRDQAGVDQSGGTVTDTDQPVLFFGTPAYDGLSANVWSVSVAGSTGVVFAQNGFGTPPNSITMPSVPDDDYTATFSVASTIRAADVFAHQQVVTFELHNIIPPPSPPLLSIEQEGEGYRLTWQDPGGQTWDDDYVIAEVWRDDCTGSYRIAAVTDGLNGSYLDLAIPQLDENGLCGPEGVPCDVTYRVRYWGYVSTTVTLPTTVPVAMVIAWPLSSAIPSGWLRVTELDGYYIRGANTTAVPTVTGGSTSHTHTTPSHTHSIPSHQHPLPSGTESSNTSTTTDRFEKADRAIANQSHDHAYTNRISGSSGTSTSGATAAGCSTVQNTPATREVIWIRSDGSATQWPVGALAYSMQSVGGWTRDSASSARHLRGAQPGLGVAGPYGTNTHTHAVSNHTHTGGNHDHPSFTSGLSGPEASTAGNAGTGSATPRWLPRHTHPVNIVAGSAGTLPFSFNNGTTGVGNSEPPHRTVFTLRNTGGGLQTRIIGLYTGAVADIPAGVTLCNGANGTPDMRSWFARDAGTGSININNGSNNHVHSVPNHTHFPDSHTHSIVVGQSNTSWSFRDTSGSLGNVPTLEHTHDSDPTQPAFTSTGPGGSGTTGNGSNLPPFREAHFVRLDGTIDGGVLPTPAQRTTEFAEITAPAISFGDGLDRLSTLTGLTMALPSDRSHAYPRLTVDSVPLDGGTHTVSTSAPGEDLTLSLAVEGKDRIDALEALLAADRVYWSPAGSEPGWFAPGGWTTERQTPDIKVVSIVLVRQPWPPVPDPADLL
jgi:hypothetical protein